MVAQRTSRYRGPACRRCRNAVPRLPNGICFRLLFHRGEIHANEERSLPATCPLVPCMAGGSAPPSGEAGGARRAGLGWRASLQWQAGLRNLWIYFLSPHSQFLFSVSYFHPRSPSPKDNPHETEKGYARGVGRNIHGIKGSVRQIILDNF